MKKSLRILHVIDSGGMYGAEKVLVNLVSEQMRMGLHPEIVSIGDKGIKEKPLEQKARKMGLPLSVFRMRPGPNLFGAIYLRNHAVRNGFDLYHSHGYKGNILLGALPAKVRRLPLVSTLHGYTNTGGFNKMRLYEWLDRVILNRLDGVVLVSPTMLTHPKLAILNKSKCHVIENGIDGWIEDETSPELNSSHVAEFCKDGFIIGAVGRLSREKGFDYLIEAFSKIAGKFSRTKLLILGEGGMRRSLEEKIHSFGLQARVLMPGYVRDAAQYMQFFDVFVLSSITEGLPVTLLEAMQAGKPVVSTRVGAMKELVHDGENGLLVEPFDSSALARAIERFCRDEKFLRNSGEKAKQEAGQKYSSKRMALEYHSLYRKILKASGKGKNGYARTLECF